MEDEFEIAWDSWIPGRKIGKKRALSAFKRVRKKYSLQEILDGIARYKVMVEGRELKYVQHFSTWLNGEEWADYVAQEYVEAKTPEELQEFREKYVNKLMSMQLPPRIEPTPEEKARVQKMMDDFKRGKPIRTERRGSSLGERR
jgi:hypothetical protein